MTRKKTNNGQGISRNNPSISGTAVNGGNSTAFEAFTLVDNADDRAQEKSSNKGYMAKQKRTPQPSQRLSSQQCTYKLEPAVDGAPREVVGWGCPPGERLVDFMQAVIGGGSADALQHPDYVDVAGGGFRAAPMSVQGRSRPNSSSSQSGDRHVANVKNAINFTDKSNGATEDGDDVAVTPHAIARKVIKDPLTQAR